MRCISCAGAGQRHPAGLVAVRGADQVPDARRAQRRGQQAERCGGPEEGAVAAVPAGEVGGRAARRRGVGSSIAGGPPDDGIGQRRVVGGRARGVGGQHDQRVRRAAGQQRRDEGLDAALPRREVVGDDQRARHGRSSRRSSRSARPTRWAAVGCDPKNHCQTAGGSGSDEVGGGQPPLHAP